MRMMPSGLGELASLIRLGSRLPTKSNNGRNRKAVCAADDPCKTSMNLMLVIQVRMDEAVTLGDDN